MSTFQRTCFQMKKYRANRLIIPSSPSSKLSMYPYNPNNSEEHFTKIRFESLQLQRSLTIMAVPSIHLYYRQTDDTDQQIQSFFFWCH